MAKRTYPIMLEPAASGGYGVIFPDFDGCVSFGVDAGAAMKNAEEALSLHIEGMAEDGEPLPDATEMRDLVLDYPGRTSDSIWAFVTIETPDASERVNVYMAKSLLERIDRFLGESGGRNRSTFFTIAARRYLEREAAGPTAIAMAPQPHYTVWAAKNAAGPLRPLSPAAPAEAFRTSAAMVGLPTRVELKPFELAVASRLTNWFGKSPMMMRVDGALPDTNSDLSSLEEATATLRRFSQPGDIVIIRPDTGEIARVDAKLFPTAESKRKGAAGKKSTT